MSLVKDWIPYGCPQGVALFFDPLRVTSMPAISAPKNTLSPTICPRHMGAWEGLPGPSGSHDAGWNGSVLGKKRPREPAPLCASAAQRA